MLAINNLIEFLKDPIGYFLTRYDYEEKRLDKPKSDAKPAVTTPAIKTITQYYLDRPIDNNWYELLPMLMRVAGSWYNLKKTYLTFDFKAIKDRVVTSSELDKIANTVSSIIDEHVPKQFRESRKKDYIDTIVNCEASHLKLANETSRFCSRLLPQD